MPNDYIVYGIKALVFSLLLFMLQTAQAAKIKVAVASNFASTLAVIAAEFEASTKHQIIISRGSTGRHYAQILNGAPFDVFLAADVQRPLRLEQQGRVVAKNRITYALGRLVLWSPRGNFVDANATVLATDVFQYIAIANPKLAPYGEATRQTLISLGLWDSLQKKIVRGENIAQTFQFVESGNAELGFIAYSQIIFNRHASGSYWPVPASLHKPIAQQAVLLNEHPASRAFFDFLQQNKTKELIRQHGYDIL